MKKTHVPFLIAILMLFAAAGPMSAQGRFIKKLKEKAEDKAIEQVFGEDKKESSTGNDGSSYGAPASESRTGNTKGEGLVTTPPDVLQNIEDADAYFGNKNYTDARFAVRQAILGIEMEMGNKILKDLPEEIGGLPFVKDEDLVASTGIGFIGMTIQRIYRQDDKEFQVIVGNDAALLSAANVYLSSGAYSSSSDQNYKTVRFGEYRGVLEFDEYFGYKLSVPFGQSSILVTNGVNFLTEKEMMDASEKIDIEKIKKILGE
jgi:hypothetical protein